MGKLTFWKWAGITAGFVTAVLFMAQVTGAVTLIAVPQGGTGSSDALADSSKATEPARFKARPGHRLCTKRHW